MIFPVLTYCEFSDTYDLECERPKKNPPQKIFTFEKDFFYAAGKQEICQKWFDISLRHFVYLHTLEKACMQYCDFQNPQCCKIWWCSKQKYCIYKRFL